MFPILYNQITSGTVPQHRGLGTLSDCVSCVVEQEKNGKYELVMEYPINGLHAEELAQRRVLKAKPNFTDPLQLFRIDRIGAVMNGKFTVYAKHISYDLSGFDISSGTAINAVGACALLQSAAPGYSITTTKEVIADFKIDRPSSVRSWFAGKKGSFLDVFGTSEIKYDNFHVSFLLHAGSNRGVTIRYGKNLLELSQEGASSNLYTHVLCYYKNEEDDAIVSEKVSTGLTLDVPKTYILDVTSEYNEAPTVQQLTERATRFKNENNLTVPSNNITLDFVQSGELTDRVDLCDTVSIFYPALGVMRSEAKCIRTKWDCIKEKYIETEFGDVVKSLEDTVAGNTAEIAQTKASVNSVYISSKEYTDAVKATLDDEIDDLQDQIDGNITTWYYNYAPTTSNLPASEWTTDEEKQKHSGDLFYDNTTQFCYRWTYQSGAWTWVLIQDTGIAQALAAAQAAQDTADNKRRIFLAEPIPPYDEGDLWIIDDNNISVCRTSRASGNFDSDDWGSAVDAIDNDTMQSALEDAINASTLLITGSTGGNVVLMRNIDSEGNYTTPYEIVIFDTAPNQPQDLAHAWHVWRWNMGGLAYSSEGYSGKFTTAITADGQIVADFITTGTLNAGAITVQGLKASMFEGQEIDLGGSANPNGVLKILDRSNNPLVVMNSDGVECFGQTENNITPSVVFNKDGVIGYSNKDDKEHSAIFWTTKDSFCMNNAVVKNELSVGGKFKLVPFTIRNSNNEIINDGIAEVPID